MIEDMPRTNKTIINIVKGSHSGGVTQNQDKLIILLNFNAPRIKKIP